MSFMRMNTKTYNIFIFLCYIFLSMVGLFFYEPWIDEAHSWLAVQDLTWFEIVEHTQYWGHPIVWYSVIMPFAKLGFPYITQSIINILFAYGCAYLILFRSPFSLTIKLLFLFSYFMIYEYAFIGRNYTIGIFWLFALASIYHQRYDRPLSYSLLVFLTANTNILLWGAAAGFGLSYLFPLLRRQRKFSSKDFIAIVIMITGGIFALYQLYPKADDIGNTLDSNLSYFKVIWGLFLMSGLNVFISFLKTNFAIDFFINIVMGTVILMTITALIYFVAMVKHSIRLWFILAASTLYVIMTISPAGEERHYGLTLIFIMITLWIYNLSAPDHRRINKCNKTIAIILATSIIGGIVAIYMNITTVKSDGKNAAKFIMENYPDYDIVSHKLILNSSLLVYMREEGYDKPFYYPSMDEYRTFAQYDKKTYSHHHLSNNKVLEIYLAKHDSNNNILIVFPETPLKDPKQYKLELVYTTNKQINNTVNESYHIYKF